MGFLQTTQDIGAPQELPLVRSIRDANSTDDLVPVHSLLELRLELMRGCPLLCAHCSVSAAPNHPLQLPMDRVLALLEEFAVLGGRDLTLTGGEPLMYPRLDEVLVKASTMGLATRLFSSGVLLEE